jgi:hypothetical protein
VTAVRARWTLLAFALGAACGGSATSPSPTPGAPDPAALFVRSLDWNPTQAAVGRVAAVVESGEQIVVLSDVSATVLASGAPIAQDSSVTGWRAGATIPAADGQGSWVVGVGADGLLRRLLATGTWEAVSDRYGLEGERVQAAVSPAEGIAVFALERGIAVADGARVTRHDLGSFAELAGAKGRIAGAAGGRVRLFDVARAEAVDYEVPGAFAAAIDSAGRLVVASAQILYVEAAGGTLVAKHVSAVPIHGLAASGERVWFAAGSEVLTLEGDTLRRSAGAMIPAPARLLGSPSGDVWVLDDGKLSRLGQDSALMAKVARWEEVVRPIFLRVCAACHLPGGLAGVNLSSYSAWIQKRDAIYDRVVVNRDMPPPGTVLREEDRSALRAWLEDPNR